MISAHYLCHEVNHENSTLCSKCIIILTQIQKKKKSFQTTNVSYDILINYLVKNDNDVYPVVLKTVYVTCRSSYKEIEIPHLI